MTEGGVARRISQLIVTDGAFGDNSLASMNAATLNSLGLFQGDSVQLTNVGVADGERSRSTLLIAWCDAEVADDTVGLNEVCACGFRVPVAAGRFDTRNQSDHQFRSRSITVSC